MFSAARKKAVSQKIHSALVMDLRRKGVMLTCDVVRDLVIFCDDIESWYKPLLRHRGLAPETCAGYGRQTNPHPNGCTFTWIAVHADNVGSHYRHEGGPGWERGSGRGYSRETPIGRSRSGEQVAATFSLHTAADVFMRRISSGDPRAPSQISRTCLLKP